VREVEQRAVASAEQIVVKARDEATRERMLVSCGRPAVVRPRPPSPARSDVDDHRRLAEEMARELSA
jgi:hypothetical protein